MTITSIEDLPWQAATSRETTTVWLDRTADADAA
jgi:hypothetical protein